MIDKYSTNHKTRILKYIEYKKENYSPEYFEKKYLIREVENAFVSAFDLYNKIKDANPLHVVEEILSSHFPHFTDTICKVLTDYIFYERIIKNNLEVFLNGLYTRQRLLFLSDLSEYSKLDTDNSYIMINLRGNFSYLDNKIIDTFLLNFPRPFKGGYPFYVSYANSLNFLFKNRLKDASLYLNKKSGLKKITKYERSTLLALKCIADRNEKMFTFELNNTLDLYHRQQFYLNLADFISIEAHGLYNIAEKIWNKAPEEQKSDFWDHDFVTYSRSNKPKLLLDFSYISPLLNTWLSELPNNIKITELVENFSKSQKPKSYLGNHIN